MTTLLEHLLERGKKLGEKRGEERGKRLGEKRGEKRGKRQGIISVLSLLLANYDEFSTDMLVACETMSLTRLHSLSKAAAERQPWSEIERFLTSKT